MAIEDHKIFDLEHALAIFDGNREMLHGIMLSFLSSVPGDLDRLASAVSTRDCDQTEHFAHRMAGAAGMVGALRFMARARQLEALSRSKRTDGAEEISRTLLADFVEFKSIAEKETQET